MIAAVSRSARTHVWLHPTEPGPSTSARGRYTLRPPLAAVDADDLLALGLRAALRAVLGLMRSADRPSPARVAGELGDLPHLTALCFTPCR